VMCSWALERLRRQPNHPSGRLDAVKNEYEAIFLRALDATLVLDDSGKCLRANPAAAELLGLTETELPGYPLDRLATLIPEFQSELLVSAITPRKVRVHRPDGASRLVECLLIRDDAFRRRILFLRDITLMSSRTRNAALWSGSRKFCSRMFSNLRKMHKAGKSTDCKIRT